MQGKWTVETSSDNQYLYIWHEDRAGQIVIKAEDAGFVVDIFNNVDESVATTYAEYNELEGEE